jgi:hypothetical protein
MSVAQQSPIGDLVLIRKTQRANRRQRDIAHCRYGTTFLHSLGRSLPFPVHSANDRVGWKHDIPKLASL